MSRLPQVNSDKGNWGRILNTWLKHIAGFRGVAPARPASGSLPAGVAVNGTGYDTTDQFQSENSGLNFHNDFPANAPTGFTFIHTVHNRIYRREGNDWAVLLEGYTPQSGEHLWRRVATGSPNIRNIPSGGFVGINTDPDARFHVLEDINETIALFDGGIVRNIAEVRIRNRNQLSNGDALLTFETSNNAVWSVGITADYNNDSQRDNFFVISVNNRFGPHSQNDPADDYLIITPNNGAVGIGNNHVPNTNLPASATLPNNGFYKLDVQGNANVWEQTTTRNFRMWDQNPQPNSVLTSVDTQGNAVWRDFVTLGLVTNAENIPINNAPATNHGWSFAQKVGTVLQFRKITAEDQNHGTLFRVRTDGDLIRIGLTGGNNGDIIWRNRNSGVYEWTNPSSIRDLLGLGTLTVGPLSSSAGVIQVNPNSFNPATSGNQNINIGFTGGSNGQFLTVNNGTYQWASFGTLTLNNTTQNVLAISPNTFVPNSNQTINIGLSGGSNGQIIWRNRNTGIYEWTDPSNIADRDWLVAQNNGGTGGPGAYNQVPSDPDQWIYTNGRVGIGTNNPRSQALIPHTNNSYGPVRLEVQDGILVPNPNNPAYFGYFNQNGIFSLYLNEDNYRSSGTYHTGNYTSRILSSHSVAIFMAYGFRRPGEGNISLPSDVNPTIIDYTRLNDDGTINWPTNIPTVFEIFVDSYDRGDNSTFNNRPVKRVFTVTDSGDVWIGGVSDQVGGRLSVTRQLRIGQIPQVTSATTVLTTDANGWVRRVPVSGVVNTGNFWSLVGNSGTNPANNFLGTTDNQPLVFRTNGSERVRIDTNGRVGIGTNNPTANLHVNGTVRFENLPGSGPHLTIDAAGNLSRTTISGGSSDRDWLVAQNNGGTGGPGAYNQVPSDPDQWIYTNGRVGIGTNSPKGMLHISTLQPGVTNVAPGAIVMSWGGNTANPSQSMIQFEYPAIPNVTDGNSHINLNRTPRFLNCFAVTQYNTTNLNAWNVHERTSFMSIYYPADSINGAPAPLTVGEILPTSLKPITGTYANDPAVGLSAIFTGRVGIGTNSPRSQALIPHTNNSYGPVRLEVQDGILVPNPNNSAYFGYFNQEGIYAVYPNTGANNYRSSGGFHFGNRTTRISSSHSVAIFMAYGFRRPGEGNISLPPDVDPTIVDYARLNDDGTIFEPTSIPTSFEIFVDSYYRGDNSTFNNRPVKRIFVVTDSGDVWIGGVSDQVGGRLSVTRQLRIGQIPQVDTATTVLTTDANGWVRRVPVSSGAPSDKRWKKNIKKIENVLEKIVLMKGVTFYWKDENKGKGKQIGLIAQDVEKAFPEAVKKDEDGYLFVNYNGLVGVTVEAIKEQQQMIEELQKTVAQQQQLIELQNQKIAQLEQKLEELANKLGS